MVRAPLALAPEGVRSDRVIEAAVRRPWIRRRRWRIALAAAGATVVLGLVLGWLLYPRLAAGAIRDKVVDRLQVRLGREVAVGSVDVDRSGHAVLRDLVVRGERDGDQPLIHIDTIRIDYGFWASLRGKVDIDRIEVDGLRATASRDAAGRDNFRDLVDRLQGRRGSGAGGGSGLRPRVIEVVSGTAVFRDERAGVVMSVGRIALRGERGGELSLRLGELAARTTVGPRATLDELVVTAEFDRVRETAGATANGGALSLWPGMSLTGIRGTLTEGERAGRLVVAMSGGYGGAPERLWRADGWVDPRARSASLALAAERFTFDKIAPVLEGTAVIDYQGTSVDAALQIDVSNGIAALAGHFGVSGLNIWHPLLASRPVRDIELGGEIAGRFDQASRTLTIDRAALTSRGVAYRLEGFAAMPRGVDAQTGQRRAAWHVGGRFDIPALPCQKMLDGIPAELTPYLAGARLDGTFDTSLRFDIDWSRLADTTLGGRVGIWGCRVRKMPEDSSAKRLQQTFTHYVEVERDTWIAFDVGPENPDFVPLAEVSPNLIKSFITTEDGAFFSHRGFIKSEFRTALIRNLESGYFSYGASSITMQMVKNVMLYSEKTLSRKLQELFLTWYVERELDKDRILEIYVNVIEYGPGLYGIGPAARRYFGKHPRDLTPVEAAFFSSILPSPKKRYRQFCEGQLWKATEAKIGRIIDLMYKRGRLTQQEYETARATPLVFDPAGVAAQAECRQQVTRALKNARPTNPLKK